MKPRSRLILIAALIISSFLCGFTYRDLGTGNGVHGVLAALQLLPGRLATAITANLGSDDTKLSATEAYWDVFTYLDANYFGEKPDPKQLTYAAIRGMLAALGDRYTRFLDPNEHKQMQEENTGNFEGIGAELEKKDGRVFITKIMGKPAERANLQPGDIILKVDDQLIQGLDIAEVVKRIRGPQGTKVKLTIKREGVPDLLEVEIERAVIPFKIVVWEMKDGDSKIGYIALRQFNEQSDQLMDDALTELEKLEMRGLVLDLRGNTGGLLEVAIDIGSRFIRGGDIVIIQNRGGQRSALPAEPSKYNHRVYPLVVLIDQNSASASEIVAGAIRDRKAGTLVGVDSFGKGLVQTIMNLEGGAAVSITTAKYFTPNGRDVNKEKIHPDVVVEPTKEDLKSKKDAQLERAVQILRERLGATQAGTRNGKRDST